MRVWVREFNKGGGAIDSEKIYAPEMPQALLVEEVDRGADLRLFSQNRRLSKDYECLPESGEAFIYVAMGRLMARRLARS